MSISALSSTLLNNANLQNPLQQLQQQFQQLGSQIQSGSLTTIQPDVVTLQSTALQPPLASPVQGIDTITQASAQTGKTSQSGSTAAPQDYTSLQQQVQNQPAQSPASHGHHHHHHASSDDDSNQSNSSQSDSTQASQLFDQLGQQIQSGNLTQAQQTFATLQQNLQTFDLSTSQGSEQVPPAIAAVSVST